MRINTPNKVEAARVQQALKALEVANKIYLKERSPELRDLAIEACDSYKNTLLKDWKAFDDYLESNKKKKMSDLKK